MERFVYNRVADNKLLNKYQSGFRSLHSTATALLDPQGSIFGPLLFLFYIKYLPCSAPKHGCLLAIQTLLLRPLALVI